MQVTILGMGCPACQALERVTREAAAELGVLVTFRTISNVHEILRHGVLTTPGLMIDGAVKSIGRVPSKAELAGWLESARLVPAG